MFFSQSYPVYCDCAVLSRLVTTSLLSYGQAMGIFTPYVVYAIFQLRVYRDIMLSDQ